jgi:DNA repair exonuclease SbcCD ATPase subunit
MWFRVATSADLTASVNAHPDEWLDTLDELALLSREDRANLIKEDGTIEDMEEEIQELKAEVISKAVSKGNEKRIRDLETDLQVFQEGKDKFDEALKEASATITRLRKERNEWRKAHNAAAQSKKDDAQTIQDLEDEIYVLEEGIWDQGLNPATIQVPLATPGGRAAEQRILDCSTRRIKTQPAQKTRKTAYEELMDSFQGSDEEQDLTTRMPPPHLPRKARETRPPTSLRGRSRSLQPSNTRTRHLR